MARKDEVAAMAKKTKNLPRGRMTVPVTAAMIEAAEPHDCYRCMVALALGYATGLQWHVMDYDARLETAGFSGRVPVWKFPPDVRELVREFDGLRAIDPTEFKMPAKYRETEHWLSRGAERFLGPRLAKKAKVPHVH